MFSQRSPTLLALSTILFTPHFCLYIIESLAEQRLLIGTIGFPEAMEHEKVAQLVYSVHIEGTRDSFVQLRASLMFMTRFPGIQGLSVRRRLPVFKSFIAFLDKT